jgi:vacuolar-type H+-ATPase subunit H
MSEGKMGEDPNKSAIMKRVRGKVAMERLEGRLVEIKKKQKSFTLTVLGVNALIWLTLLAITRDVDKTNKVYTNTFQYQAVAWCCWFMLPYFLRVEAKQDVGIAMGHDTVDLMDKLDEAVESRLKRVDELMTKLDNAVSDAEKGHHPLFEKAKKAMQDEMKKLRESIEKARTNTEEELGAALDEGEREAAEIEGGKPKDS